MPKGGGTTRRAFIRRAAHGTLGVGLGLALPNIFLNRTKAETGEAPSELIRLGFIGVGLQGRQHLRVLAKRAVAICDVDRARLDAARAEHKEATGRLCNAYTDYRRLLEDKSVDAVVISTPDHWHALQVVHACEAGKDVYCEKPLTLTIHEGKVLVKVVGRTGRVLQTGCQQRSDAKFRLACQLVRSGRLGRIKQIRVGIPGVNFPGPDPTKLPAPPVPDSEPPPELDYDMWLGPAPRRPYNVLRVHYNFRFFWDYSGGQLTNWGTHHLDIVQWALGADETGPVCIEGRARYHAQRWFEVPEWFEVTYRYADGTTVMCSTDAKHGVEFIGEHGRLYVNRGVIEAEPEELLDEAALPKASHIQVSTDHHENWFSAIKARTQPIGHVVAGHRSATVCHLGNIAILTGRKIRWDPAAEQIIGDEEAAKLLSRPYRPPWQLPDA
ncbi:MAG: Gfo/Idh/MocA family oxidoreductase [Verrucomicrobiae bacterium]|nr:Gfo/Idh/MocA family oxidoreductase [Verrucomicrobiae bacterium]